MEKVHNPRSCKLEKSVDIGLRDGLQFSLPMKKTKQEKWVQCVCQVGMAFSNLTPPRKADHLSRLSSWPGGHRIRDTLSCARLVFNHKMLYNLNKCSGRWCTKPPFLGVSNTNKLAGTTFPSRGAKRPVSSRLISKTMVSAIYRPDHILLTPYVYRAHHIIV